MDNIVECEENKLILQITAKLIGSLLGMEKAILDGCNEMESLTTAETLLNNLGGRFVYERHYFKPEPPKLIKLELLKQK